MPGFDGTGPRGMGPITGGGRGFCAVPLPAAGPAYMGRTAYPPYGVPWGTPYYGRGRGGLPRRWYPGAAMVSPYPPAQPIYAPKMTPEGEIDWLKSQAEAIRTELNQTEARIHDLGTGK